MYKCECCGEKTIEKLGWFLPCDNCGWCEDIVQTKRPDYRGGYNVISLNEAKEIYKKSLLNGLNPVEEFEKANLYAGEHWNLKAERERKKRLGID